MQKSEDILAIPSALPLRMREENPPATAYPRSASLAKDGVGFSSTRDRRRIYTRENWLSKL